MPPISLPYRPKPFIMALAGLFFAGCSVVLFNVARTNDRGLVLNGIIHFETGGATIFYWLLTALSAGFVVFAVLGVARAVGAPQTVELDDRSLSAPRSGISAKIVTVPLADITGLQLQEVNRQRFLKVIHTGGKLTISASMLPSSGDLDVLAEEIDRRRAAALNAPLPTTPTPDAMPPRGFGRRGL